MLITNFLIDICNIKLILYGYLKENTWEIIIAQVTNVVYIL